MTSAYVYPGLRTKEATRVRNNYFMQKMKQAKQKFANSNGQKKPFHEVKLDRLVIALEEFTNITKEELLSYDKPRRLADVRNVFIAVAVRQSLGGLKDIASYMNRTNHSTIHTAAKKGHALIKQDSDLNDLYKKLVFVAT
jgi:chromosomal replication initiation ATPase DnaA